VRVCRTDHLSPLGPDYAAALERLERVPDVSIVAAPGASSADVLEALIAHVQRMPYRFAILDPPQMRGFRCGSRYSILVATDSASAHTPAR